MLNLYELQIFMFVKKKPFMNNSKYILIRFKIISSFEIVTPVT